MCVFRDYLAGHDYCCVLVVCWAVGGAPSRARALTARWRGVSRTRTPRWYVADAFRAHCGNASVAPARRHAARWAGPRRACRMGGPPATSWPAPLWAGDARAASGRATWKQLGRPRKRAPRAARCLFCLFRRFVSHASDMMVHAVRAIAERIPRTRARRPHGRRRGRESLKVGAPRRHSRCA